METVLVERDGGIVTVTLNKPEKKNAVDPEQWAELSRIWDDIGRNPGGTVPSSSPVPGATSAPAHPGSCLACSRWPRPRSSLASGPPIALGLTKRLLNDSCSRTLQEALEAEAMAQSITLQANDTAEAIASFVEKRNPTFHGR